MKIDKLDIVSVVSGKYAGEVGQVLGFSIVHRNSIPDMADYQVTFRHLSVTEEFKENNLTLIKKYDPEEVERERQKKIADDRAEAARISDLKMEEALRAKIRKEFEIREEMEKEFAARKAAQTPTE